MIRYLVVIWIILVIRRDKILKIIIKLIILVCLVIAGFYGYLYWKIKVNVDYVLSEASPYVDITYQSIGINYSMDGSITLKDIEMAPSALFAANLPPGDNAVTIESIEFRLDSVLDYFLLDRKLHNLKQNTKNPIKQFDSMIRIIPKIQLKVNHLKVDANQFAGLGKNLKKDEFETHIAQLKSLMCNGLLSDWENEPLYPEDLMPKLGYAKYDSSIELDYEFDEYASMIDLKFGFTVHDAGDYFIKTRVSGIEPLASMILNQENLLTTITFGIHDLGYNERFIKYCAKRMERKSENYLDAVMGDFKKIITQMGLTLSDDIYHIVKAFNSPQSKIEFKFMPENLSNLQYFNQYEINQWPYILGMTVKVNGKDYNDFSFKINKKTEVEKEQKLNKTESLKSKEPLVEAPKNKNEPLKNKKLKKKKSLVEVPISELKNYIKSYAVIKLKSGKEFKGLIIKSEKNKIQLKIKKSGGYMELPINLEKIDKVVIYK